MEDNEAGSLFGVIGVVATVLIAVYLYVPILFYVLLGLVGIWLLSFIALGLSKIINKVTEGRND